MDKKYLTINLKSFLALILTFILIFSVMSPIAMATATGYDEKYEQENEISGEVIDFSNQEKFDFSKHLSYGDLEEDHYKITKIIGSDFLRDEAVPEPFYEYTITLNDLTAKKIILPYDDADGGKPFYSKSPRQTHITIILQGKNKVTGYGISGGYTRGVTITGTGTLDIQAHKERKTERVLDMNTAELTEEQIKTGNIPDEKYTEKTSDYIVPGIILETDAINESDPTSGFIIKSTGAITINSPYYWGIICNGDIKFAESSNVTIKADPKGKKVAQSGAISADHIIKEDSNCLKIENGGATVELKQDEVKVPEKELRLAKNDTIAPTISGEGIVEGGFACENPIITVSDDTRIDSIEVNGIEITKFITNTYKKKTFAIPTYMNADKIIVAKDSDGNETVFTFRSNNGHIAGNGTVKSSSAATCTTDGYREIEYECLVCHQTLKNETVIDSALGHNYGNWKYYSDTEEVRTCDRCGTQEKRNSTVKISNTNIALSNSSYVYDGNEKKPTVTVKDGSKTLKQGKDFTTSYNNNIEVGKATVTVTGINHYTGKTTKNFTIVKQPEKKNVEVTIPDVVEKTDPATKPAGSVKSIPSISVPVSTDKKSTSVSKPVNNSITASNFTKTASTKSQSFKINAKQVGNGKLTYKSNNKSVTVNSSGKVTIKAKFVGKATITITSSATSKYNKATKKITITVKPSKVSISKVSNTKGKKLTAKWKKNVTCGGYQIQISTDKKFKKNVKTITIKKNSTVSKTIAKLTKNKKYYVRIRGYKTVSKVNYYSVWSSIKNVKIKK